MHAAAKRKIEFTDERAPSGADRGGTILAEPATETGQLERAAQMRSPALSDTIHELRTPLVTIRGYTRMLLDGRGGPLNAAQRQYLEIVFENASKMVSLLRQLQNSSTQLQVRTQEFHFTIPETGARK